MINAKQSIKDSVNQRIKDAQEHLNFLLDVQKILEDKDLQIGDVAFYNYKNNMKTCIICNIYIPTFQMFKSGKKDILAAIRTSDHSEIKVLYSNLFKYNDASRLLFE